MEDMKSSAAPGAAFPFGIHEFAVNGSVIEQTVAFLDEHMKPSETTLIEPGTNLVVPALISRHGITAVPEIIFDDYRSQPKRRRGTATMLDLDSFIMHVNRFSDDDTAIFANNDRAQPSLTAVLDYHKAGSDADPRFGKHRTTFKFPVSDEWKAWAAQNKTPMSMQDFAFFLEDRIIDVMPVAAISLNDEARRFIDALPGGSLEGKIADPAKLMQIASEFKVLENSTVGETRNLASGEATIEFSSTHIDERGQKLTIPQLFVIGIPVFMNGEGYQVLARFRYRKQGGSVMFWYDLWRTDRVFDHAFDEACAKVREETAKPVFIGKDEGASA